MIYWVIWFLSLLGIFSDLWLTESLNYFLPKHIVKWDYGRAKYLLLFVIGCQIFTSTLVSSLLYFSSEWLALNFFHEPKIEPVIQIMSLFFLWIHIVQIFISFFSSIQNVKIQKLVEFLRMLFTATWAIILFFTSKWNILYYCWIWIIWIYFAGAIWGVIFYIWYYKKYFTIPKISDKILRKTFIQYSLWTLLSANVGVLLHLMDQLFITYFLGVSDAWEYKNYLSLTNIPFVFLSPMIGFLYPVISEIWNTSDTTKITTIYKIFSTYMATIMLWVWWFFILTGPAIAGLLFGWAYLTSWEALYFIAPFLFLNVLIQLNFQILSGLGHIRKRIWILFWTLIINSILTLSFILGYKYNILPFPSGSSAASFWVGLSWIFMWILSYRSIREYWKWFDWKFFLWNAFSIAALVTISLSYIPIFWEINNMTTRIEYLKPILLAIFMCLVIFLTINRTHLQNFIQTIQKVRSGKI